jgi:predicted anti-sigma-YlaC factor YlaD
MEARATFDSRASTRAFMVVLVAVVAALLVGGAGGYIVRALTYSVARTVTTDAHRPFVVESVPYSSPEASPAVAPLRDPNGYEIHI